MIYSNKIKSNINCLFLLKGKETMNYINELGKELKNLGITDGDVILMHPSLKSLGVKEISPEIVISALLNVIGEGGTLILPCLSYAEVTDKKPIFSVTSTPCCVGAIPEYFRTRKKTIRSVHPTHSVCATGALAYEITKDHIKDTTPVGFNSPFTLLPKYDGKILMLGCGLRPNTSMHGIEEAAGAPYCLNDYDTHYEILLENDVVIRSAHKRHNFNDIIQRYDKITEILNNDEIKYGKVLNANCHLIDSKALWQKGVIAIKKEPYRFVEKLNTY